MHNQRVKTALLLLPALILLVSLGGPFLFFILITIVSLLSLSEYDKIVANIGSVNPGKPSLVMKLAAYLATPVFLYGVYSLKISLIFISVGIMFLPAAFVLLSKFNSIDSELRDDPQLVGSVLKHVHGFLYVPFLLSFLIMIRGVESTGVHWIYLLLLVVAGCDTGAYYTGTYIGKHKLCPNISPKKTKEGFVGGVFTAVIAGSLYASFFLPELNLMAAIPMMALTAAFGAAGDLYESVLKRAGGIKDSGNLLPGHGGMLDRIDALMFGAPVIFMFKEVLL